MAKTRALTWQNIFQDDKIRQLANELNIPVEQLSQRTHNDKVLPLNSIIYFFNKSAAHIKIALLNHRYLERFYGENREFEKVAGVQIIHEQIAFAYEFLFKGLVTVEYKAFNKEHTIGKLYDILEDEEIKNLISESVIDKWNSVDRFIGFIDSIVPSDRRYFSYDFCFTFEDFIANRPSQWFPLIDHKKVGVVPLIDVFMNIYNHAYKKAFQMSKSWEIVLKELKKIYPKRFERLHQQWSK